MHHIIDFKETIIFFEKEYEINRSRCILNSFQADAGWCVISSHMETAVRTKLISM